MAVLRGKKVGRTQRVEHNRAIRRIIVTELYRPDLFSSYLGHPSEINEHKK